MFAFRGNDLRGQITGRSDIRYGQNVSTEPDTPVSENLLWREFAGRCRRFDLFGEMVREFFRDNDIADLVL